MLWIDATIINVTYSFLKINNPAVRFKDNKKVCLYTRWKWQDQSVSLHNCFFSSSFSSCRLLYKCSAESVSAWFNHNIIYNLNLKLIRSSFSGFKQTCLTWTNTHHESVNMYAIIKSIPKTFHPVLHTANSDYLIYFCFLFHLSPRGAALQLEWQQ